MGTPSSLRGSAAAGHAGAACSDAVGGTPPASVDGSEGFVIHIESGKVKDVNVTSVTFSQDAPLLAKLLVNKDASPDALKAVIQNQLDQQNSVYERNLIPSKVVIDPDRKQSYDGQTVRLNLRIEKIYPEQGKDWYITVSGLRTVTG